MALSKIYTLQSLQHWFEAYRKCWWNLFSTAEVNRGIELLDRGGVKVFEVHENYVLICGTYENSACFSTIDLKNDGQIEIQASHSNERFIKELSAAALLILEKLFEDHLQVLSLGEKVVGEVSQEIPVEAEKRMSNEPTVKLVFEKREQAIFFEVFFKRQGVFEKLNSLNQVVKPSERECLLSIILLSQKYGFKWNKDGWLSSNLDKLPSFVSDVLPKFSQKYFVECPHCIKNLQKSNPSVQLMLSANEKGGLNQRFFLKQTLLDPEIIQQSMRAKHHVYWSEHYGLIRMQENALVWLQRINDWKNRFGEDGLPAYLLLSIFNPNTSGEAAKAWIKTLQATKNNACLPKIPLRSYQKQGIIWLKQMIDNHCHPLLADEMGLGKTRQLMSLLELMTPLEPLPSLVVCPASVISAWQNEHEACFKTLPMEVLTHETLKRYVGGCKIFVASYSQLLAHWSTLKLLTFNCVILDEAQFIKNPKSKTAHACFNLKAKHRIAATGTPLENNLTDVWSIFHFLMPGLLGTFKEFQKFLQNEINCQRLKIQIAPFILRRTQKEVLKELPEKQENVVYCPMTQTQRKLYAETLQMRSSIQKGQWMQLFTLILRLRQICCDPGMLPGQSDMGIQMSGKLIWLLETLSNKTQAFKKVIIFSQFATLLERLQPALEHLFSTTYLLTGQTLACHRRKMIQEFQTKDQRAAFLISLKAGGTGITLHAADSVFILDPWWNPSVEKQAVARAHRLGQKKALAVYRLLIENSIESSIQRLQRDKSVLFEQLLEDDNASRSSDRWQQLYDILMNG